MAGRHQVIIIAMLATSCDAKSGGLTTLSVSNKTNDDAVVYVKFGDGSKVSADDWPVCDSSGDSCKFSLAAGGSQPLPANKYLNASISFNGAVACGNTKAELDINNPNWYDTLDVSLVDGYSNDIEIIVSGPAGVERLGRPQASGNNMVLGLFPYGCDICVERLNPPCGIAKGKFGCKSGTQYNPDVPCQWSGGQNGGGGIGVDIALVK